MVCLALKQLTRNKILHLVNDTPSKHFTKILTVRSLIPINYNRGLNC